MQREVSRFPFHVAVIGAGMAGLTCARELTARGATVTLFDKGRSPGGRLATRRAPPHAFDLGAQYFTARDPAFAECVREWKSAGVCDLWRARLVSVANAGAGLLPVAASLDRFVGQPGMSALAGYLAAPLDLRASQRVERIEREGVRLHLFGSIGAPGVTLTPSPGGAASADASELRSADLGAFDRVAVCLPPSQAAPLLAASSPALAARAAQVSMEPCIAVGWAASDEDTPALRALPFDGVFIGRDGAPPVSPLAWVARDSSKPGRAPGERWVLHASPTWSALHIERSDAELASALVSELATLFELGPRTPTPSVVQRWALARAPAPLETDVLYDATAGIGLAGDWVCGGRVEGAFASGRALAARITEARAPANSVA